MDQASPLCFCVLQAVKNWTVGRSGTEPVRVGSGGEEGGGRGTRVRFLRNCQEIFLHLNLQNGSVLQRLIFLSLELRILG